MNAKMIAELLTQLDEKAEEDFLRKIYWIIKLHIRRRKGGRT